MTTRHGTTEHRATRRGTLGTTTTGARRSLVRALAAAGVCAVAVALTGCAGSGEGVRVEGPSAIPADLARVDAGDAEARPGPVALRILDGVGVNIAEGQTVGVGVPISVTFARPVAKAERALVERQLQVAAEPGTEGSWSWVRDRDLADGQRVDFRPRASWKPGTKVTVRVGASLTRHFTAVAR